MKRIVLASTSKYRKRLMAEAGFEVECVNPCYEETVIEGISPLEQISQFALGKAKNVYKMRPECIVIGSDQGLVEGEMWLGKPGSVEAACAQLKRLRGKTAILATSVVVISGDNVQHEQNRAELHFRENISDESIERYVKSDMPLDCAGSFKIEARGVRLFSSIMCDDPTAIQGLPMMSLNRMILAVEPEYDTIF